MEVKINPLILKWAREERGISPEDASAKLGISLFELENLEKKETEISYDFLDKAALLYKRQTTVFFLPSVPQKVKVAKDYRNLQKAINGFKVETLLAMRRADRFLGVVKDLISPSVLKEQYRWLDSKLFIGTRGTLLEKDLRQFLETPIQEQIDQRDPESAFRYWRNVVEAKLGVYTFQFAIPDNELDGFSYSLDGYPYAIVLNSINAPVRKIFTLFHELAHIINKEPGACLTEISLVKSENNKELSCNTFAGRFLVPVEDIIDTQSVEEIFELAGKFKVSGETYLRRLLEEKRITDPQFFYLLELVREKSEGFKKKNNDRDGHPTGVILSKSSRGKKFYNLIIESAVANKISYSSARDLLGLKVANIRF